MNPLFPKPGDLFEGRYQIERVLGEGGFARVYLANQTNLDRQVAIKVLAPVDVDSTVWAQRFEREAKVISRFKNPHTVNMYDYGQTDDALTYMVLEYVEGDELSAVLEQRGTMTAAETVQIVRQILESLREAHAMGVVHRDMKPQNIIVYEHLGEGNKIKVLDFGIARLIENDTKGKNQLTADQSVVGTPSYMAPEQVAGAPVTAACDLYSVGLIAYEMLTGSRAADGDNTIATMAVHISENPILVPPSVEIPASLRSIIDTMMEKPLAYRYENADEVLRDLEHWNEARIQPKVMSERLQQRTRTLPQRVPQSVEVKQNQVNAQFRLIRILIGSIVSVALLAAIAVKMTSMVTPKDEGIEIEPVAAIGETPKEIEEIPDKLNEAATAQLVEEPVIEEPVIEEPPVEADEKVEKTATISAAAKKAKKKKRALEKRLAKEREAEEAKKAEEARVARDAEKAAEAKAAAEKIAAEKRAAEKRATDKKLAEKKAAAEKAAKKKKDAAEQKRLAEEKKNAEEKKKVKVPVTF